MHTETSIILMMMVAVGVAVIATRLRLPYTVALVLTGLGLGQLGAFEPLHLTQELLFAVFLPGLLFEAAFHVDFAEFRKDRALILGLAVPGVMAAILLTAAILIPVSAVLPLSEEFGWPHALVFGALIAATDPIAVVGLFRSLGAPKRLTALLEGESLFNDGTAIVVFGLIVGVVGGASASVGGVSLGFLRVVGLGAASGVVIGLLVSIVIQRVDDPMIEIMLTTIAAYAAFAGAERIGGSGVIGTVIAGMLCGNLGARGMGPTTRVAVESFWAYVAFALNSVIFLLIGLEVHLADLLASWPFIVSAFLAVLLGRTAVVYAASALLARGAARIPSKWRVLLSWGGLRGGLSMVLALSLPATMPHRGLLIDITFGVVLLSLLVQGLTMAPLLRFLGVGSPGPARIAYDRVRTELQTTQVALRELEEMMQLGQADRGGLEGLKREYTERAERLEGELRRLHSEGKDLHLENLRRARGQLLMVEKAHAIEAHQHGTLSRKAYEQILDDIDRRLLESDPDGHS